MAKIGSIRITLWLLVTLMTLATPSLTLGVEVSKGFKSDKIEVANTSYHVYSAGNGASTILLLHGYAENAQMWFPLMENWKSKHRVIAPDLKGIGESAIGKSGYDKKTLAAEIKLILDRVGVKRAIVIGHDIGLMVAYAFASQFPEMTEKLVLMDAFIPGVGPGDKIYNSPDIWHFRFNGPYAERLVKGRERIYFDDLWVGFAAHPERFKESQKNGYLQSYSREGRMRAGWEYFRAMPRDAEDNKHFSSTKLKMPVLSLGGEKSLGQAMAETVQVIAEKPTSRIIPDCGHWMIEECQVPTIAALEEFLGFHS